MKSGYIGREKRLYGNKASGDIATRRSGPWLIIRSCLLAVSLVPAVILAGCRHANSTSTDPWLQAHGTGIDAVQSHLEAYGTISISPPLIVQPDERFTFDLARTGQQYFDDAKNSVQGSISSLDQRFQGFGLNASAQIDPVQALNYADALQQAMAQRNVASQRDALGAEAARDRYEAALVTAGQVSDPVARASQIASAKAAYAAALQDPSARSAMPTINTAAGANVPAPAPAPSTVSDPSAVLANSKFAALLGLRTAPGPTLSSRAALITAAGDKAIQSVFGMLALKPDDAKKLTDAEIFVGLTMVSVNPGWLTRKGFGGDIAVAMDINYRTAREETVQRFLKRDDVNVQLQRSIAEDMGYVNAPWLSDRVKKTARIALAELQVPANLYSIVLDDPDESARDALEGYAIPDQSEPLAVAAISPMSDTQTLDLASAQRQRTEFALGLALSFRAAGQEAAAGMLERWAHQLETDAQTRTNEVTVNAFSSGNVFGYRVLPGFHAIANPGEPHPRAGMRLDNATFPAVFTLAVERRKLRVAIVYNKANRTFALAEPSLRFRALPHWRPLEQSYARYRVGFVDQAEGARALAAASAALGDIKDRGLQELSRLQLAEMKTNYNGSFSSHSLPVESLMWPARIPPEAPSVRIQKVLPDDFQLAVGPDQKPVPADVDVMVLGENLDQIDLAKIQILTTNAKLRAGVAPRHDGVGIVLPLAIADADTSAVLSLPTKSDPVVVVFPVTLKAGPKTPLVVSVESKSGVEDTVHSVQIPASASAATLDAARQLLEAVRPAAPAADAPKSSPGKGDANGSAASSTPKK